MAAARIRDLLPTETVLQGGAVDLGTQVVPDEVNGRISYLVRERLRSVGIAQDGWLHLFQDPVDGRYWELSYPDGKGDRTGARRLSVVDRQAAVVRYGLNTG